MDFQTLVDTDAVGIKIEHDEAVMMLGSCFAEDVGNLLKRSMLTLCINPFGTLYNPRSIAQSLRRLMADLPFSADELVAYGNLWHSMSHHSRFSSVDKDKALQKINAAYAEGVACLRSARHLIVTFGTAYTFSTADGETVANCHKMPASMFNRRMLSANEIADEWIPLIDDIRKFNPHIDITFTVSPVRHLADGAHGNQLSKSTLLLAADSIMAQRPGVCHYFPSYEIMLDQLRDYRFFAADMVCRRTVQGLVPVRPCTPGLHTLRKGVCTTAPPPADRRLRSRRSIPRCHSPCCRHLVGGYALRENNNRQTS